MNLQCPQCQVQLTELKGHKIGTDGVTLRCNNDKCPCQEVEAWGKNIKDAMEVIIHRFGRKKE